MGKLIAENRKARHDYFIEDRYEAGIVLQGTEIKSVRLGHVQDVYKRQMKVRLFRLLVPTALVKRHFYTQSAD